jgi:hypothetical protein
MPENAVIPMQWMTVAMWLREQDGETFQTKSVLESPDGQNVVETPPTEITFINNGQPTEHHRLFERIHGFPIAPQGKYWLKLLRRSGGDFVEVARFPIRITYVNEQPQI